MNTGDSTPRPTTPAGAQALAVAQGATAPEGSAQPRTLTEAPAAEDGPGHSVRPFAGTGDAPAPAQTEAPAGPGNLRSGAVIPLAKDETEVKLSDGRTARVIEGTGYQVMEARRAANNDSSKMSFALCSTCTTIDGAPVVMEDLLALPMRDFLDIEDAFNVKNGLLG